MTRGPAEGEAGACARAEGTVGRNESPGPSGSPRLNASVPSGYGKDTIYDPDSSSICVFRFWSSVRISRSL